MLDRTASPSRSELRRSLLRGLGAVALLVASTVAPGAAAEPGTAAETDRRPRVGLVLSGGGARGAAHVGVLQVLEEMRVPVDAVAGTSMGSLIGGLYAAGMSPDELAATLSSLDWNDALADRTARDLLAYRRKQDDVALATKIKLGLRGWKPALPLGLVQGQKLENLLRSYVLPVATIDDFDRLVVPYRAVAADLANIEEVVLAGGDLVQAMRASMSVPGVFAPVEIDGRLLIDGGVANNLPVDVVRKMGVDVVIAVDIGTPLSSLEEIRSPLDVTGQMNTGMMERETSLRRRSLGEGDVLIVPDLGPFGASDFTRCAEIVPRGAEAARSAADLLRRYSLSEEAWAAHVASRTVPSREPPTIREVRVVHDTDLATEYLAGLLTVAPGRPLDLGALDRDLRRLYGLDLFDKVDYRLVDAAGGAATLEIRARQRGSGRDYLQFGLGLRSDFESQADFDLAVRLNRFALNRSGAEWRTDLRVGDRNLLRTEVYQPLGGVAGYFAAAGGEVRRDSTFLVDLQGASVPYRLTASGASVDVGRALGLWGEVRLGLSRLHGSLDPERGVTGREKRDFDDGNVHLTLAADTADDASFPRRGTVVRFEIAQSLESLGADDDLLRAYARLDGARSFGRNTLAAGIEAGAFLDEDAVGIPFTLGGFGRLSGLGEVRLPGRYIGLVRLLGYRQVKKVTLSAIEMPIYVGGTLEAGHAWLERDAVDAGDAQLHGSIFVGVDSPLGPVYLAGAVGDDGDRAAYFAIGRTF